jgi:hypothetical protein
MAGCELNTSYSSQGQMADLFGTHKTKHLHGVNWLVSQDKSVNI